MTPIYAPCAAEHQQTMAANCATFFVRHAHSTDARTMWTVHQDTRDVTVGDVTLCCRITLRAPASQLTRSQRTSVPNVGALADKVEHR